MRVIALHRRSSRKPDVRQHRINRQRFKPGHLRIVLDKCLATTTYFLRVHRSIPMRPCRQTMLAKSSRTTVASQSQTVQLGQPCISHIWGQSDTWFDIENLWRRMAVFCPFSVMDTGEDLMVVFSNVRAVDWNDETSALIDRVLDRQSYRWHQDGRCGDYVQCVEFQGANLEITLAPQLQMFRWLDGEDIGLRVKRFLQQIQHDGASW